MAVTGAALRLFVLLVAAGVRAASLTSEGELLAELKVLMQKTQTAQPEYFSKGSVANRKIWEDYYDCLDKQLEVVVLHRRLPGKAVSALEGGTARLDCELCFPPSLLDSDSPRWTWAGEVLPEDDWMEVDTRTGRLSLYGLRAEQGGRYQCALGSARSRPVLLQVHSPQAGLALVRGPNAPQGPSPAADVTLPLPPATLIVFSEWSAWSECSRCGEVGKRYRFGACTVRLQTEEEAKTSKQTAISRSEIRKIRVLGKTGRPDYDSYAVRRRRGILEGFNPTGRYVKTFKELFHRGHANHIRVSSSRSSTSSTSEPPKRTLFPFLPSAKDRNTTAMPQTGSISSYEIYLLQLFSEGLPCSSQLLSVALRNTRRLKRKNELMEAYCKPPCTDEIFEVRDQSGNILERVNNSAGYFSMLQGPPQIPPVPTRTTIFAPAGEPLEFACPGHLLNDVPFYWTVNRTSRLYPGVIANQSAGRVTIDFMQRIVMKDVEPEDGRLYVCWQRDSIAGVVRLVVYDPSRVVIDHHLLLIGSAVILGTFVYVFARIYLNKKRAAAA